MAHTRRSELKPNHSSSSEEEEDDDKQTSESEEMSDSESEEMQKQKLKKPPISSSQSAKKPQSPDLSSSGTEESGSDSDSGLPPKKPKAKDPTAADPNIKPIASKPMGKEDEEANLDNKSAKKHISKSKTSSTPPPAKSGKRPAPASEKDAKKAKKSTAADDDMKKQLFQRLWSEDDEIAILKGMIDYKTEKKGADPVADMGAFLDYIKKSLHVDVSKTQLTDKVRRLKKKYVNNASKEKNGNRNFSKSHEQKGYDLSKLIWGSSDGNTSGTVSKQNQSEKNGSVKGNAASTSTAAVTKAKGVDVDKEVSTMEVAKNVDVSRFVRYNGGKVPVVEEEIVKGGLELSMGSKKEEFEEKWKNLKVQELELYVKRMDMVREQAALVLEAIKSSRN